MITSDIIRRKDFPRGRGYSEKEVDEFLDMVAADLDILMSEAAGLRERVKDLLQENERYRNSENTVFGTLEAAKSLMTDISSSAEKRAEIVLKNAELDAERTRREAQDAATNMTEEAVALSRRWELFSARFRNLLETELERFESFAASDLFGEAGVPVSRNDSDVFSDIYPKNTFKMTRK